MSQWIEADTLRDVFVDGGHVGPVLGGVLKACGPETIHIAKGRYTCEWIELLPGDKLVELNLNTMGTPCRLKQEWQKSIAGFAVKLKLQLIIHSFHYFVCKVCGV